jgi:hypothetical protein
VSEKQGQDQFVSEIWFCLETASVAIHLRGSAKTEAAGHILSLTAQ